MAFDTFPVFPSLPGRAYPVTRISQFQTRTETANSGKIVTMPDWTFPLYTWQVDHNVLRQGTLYGVAFNEFQQLFSLFNRCQGSFAAFLYSDPTDCTVTDQSLGTGNGVTLNFALLRTLSNFYTDRILAPDLTQPVTVKVGGVTQAIGTYTVTPYGTTDVAGPGMLKFNIPPTGIITISYNYYWPCRFLSGSQPFSKLTPGRYEAKGLKFMSLRL